MSGSKMRIILLLIITGSIILFIGCSSTSIDEDSALMDGPEWLRKPPVSSELIYGIGCAEDEKTAKELALVNAAQQFSTHVKSELILQESDGFGDRASILKTFDEQITEYTLKGAKFVEKYVDQKEQTWLLVEAPLNCLLDGTESILISHILTSEAILAEESPDDLTTAQAISDFRENLRERIGDSVTRMVQSEGFVEQIAETGYVDPGYLVSYSANEADKGRPPIDSNLYSSGDLIYVPGNSGWLSKDGRTAFGWTTESDGSGQFYREGSLMSIEEEDVVLYAQYVMNDVSAPTGYNLSNKVLPQNRTITVDGMMDDWIGVSSLKIDSLNDSRTDQREDADIAALYFAKDDEYLYIMVRATAIPLPRQNIAYYFNFYNSQQNSIMFFDLFHENNSSKYSSYRKNADAAGSNVEWQALYSRMRVKTDEVMEIAMPLNVLQKSQLYSNEMKFYLVARARNAQEPIDDISDVYVQFNDE